MAQDYIYDQLGKDDDTITMNRIITYGDGCIFQGGVAAAHDLQRLRNQNIGLVVNCTSNVHSPVWANQPHTPVYVVFPMCGMFSAAARQGRGCLSELEPLFEHIQQTLVRDRLNVMIHCRQGTHRAGTLGVILAMHFLRLTPGEAFGHVRRKRRATRVIGRNLDIVLQVAAEMDNMMPRRQQLPPAPASPPAPATTSKATNINHTTNLLCVRLDVYSWFFHHHHHHRTSIRRLLLRRHLQPQPQQWRLLFST